MESPSPTGEEVPLLGVEIRDVAQRRLVTLIEILAPVSKRGEGVRDYAAWCTRDCSISHAAGAAPSTSSPAATSQMATMTAAAAQLAGLPSLMRAWAWARQSALTGAGMRRSTSTRSSR